MSALKLIIAGVSGGTNVGGSFLKAAAGLGVEARLIDTRLAQSPFRAVNALSRRLLRRPLKLAAFSRRLLGECDSMGTDLLLSTGLAPIDRATLKALRGRGVTTLNFLTDDPWNPAHTSGWFFEALPAYEWVYSPRRSNLNDLKKIGCKNVAYLPFAMQTEYFFTTAPDIAYESDVMFAGGADAERVPWIAALDKAGFKTAIYGAYWERFASTRHLGKGLADAATLRIAMASAKVALCLVRRSNRDGHSMRTFEIPAVGGFMLAEDTYEHREFFGTEGTATLYFSSIQEMLKKIHWALERPQERRRMADNAHHLITSGHHTYRDRLQTMLQGVA